MVGRFHTVKCCLHCVNVRMVPGGDSLHGQKQAYLHLTAWSSGIFSLKVTYATKLLLAASVMPVQVTKYAFAHACSFSTMCNIQERYHGGAVCWA